MGAAPQQHAAHAVRRRPARRCAGSTTAVAATRSSTSTCRCRACSTSTCGATQELHRATPTFLGNDTAHVPFVIGLAGSVAVGKSTTARILQALLARWPDHPAVDLVTTDGFLFPNAVLEARGLMHRKGFPESYDRAPAGALPGRREVRASPKCTRRSTRTCATTSSPARRSGARARHRDRRGAERAAGAAATRLGTQCSCRTSSTSRSTSTPTSSDIEQLVRRALPEAARHGLPDPTVLLPPLRVADRSRSAARRRRASGARSTA